MAAASWLEAAAGGHAVGGDALPDVLFCGCCGNHFVSGATLLPRCTECGELVDPEPSDWGDIEALAAAPDGLDDGAPFAPWPFADDELFALDEADWAVS